MKRTFSKDKATYVKGNICFEVSKANPILRVRLVKRANAQNKGKGESND